MEISDMAGEKKESQVIDNKFGETIVNLPRVKDPMLDRYYYLYQGFWVPDVALEGVISFQKHFVAQDGDVLLASCPKSGTTWLKALIFTIVNRTRFALADSPLIVANPHELVPTMGHVSDTMYFQSPSLQSMKPRLFSTHMPYSSLPPSIKSSNCKIVYICRNPFDLFVSYWHFIAKLYGENVEPNHLEENFNAFFGGIHSFGPFWDHALGYWKASIEAPTKNNILFLKYEDLKKDTEFCIKKLAAFLGCPFSEEEEKQGVVEEISSFCSLEKMRCLEVNKNGRRSLGVSNSAFFRKGEVGDWVNYLTPEMVERGKKLIEEKFRESTLSFDFKPLQF